MPVPIEPVGPRHNFILIKQFPIFSYVSLRIYASFSCNDVTSNDEIWLFRGHSKISFKFLD